MEKKKFRERYKSTINLQSILGRHFSWCFFQSSKYLYSYFNLCTLLYLTSLLKPTNCFERRFFSFWWTFGSTFLIVKPLPYTPFKWPFDLLSNMLRKSRISVLKKIKKVFFFSHYSPRHYTIFCFFFVKKERNEIKLKHWITKKRLELTLYFWIYSFWLQNSRLWSQTLEQGDG